MWNVLHTLARFAGDFAAGVDAGHAVRHGLPASDRARRPAATDAPPRPVCTAWCRTENGMCFPAYPGPRLPGAPRVLTRDGCREVS
jgi:hypothetical protein